MTAARVTGLPSRCAQPCVAGVKHGGSDSQRLWQHMAVSRLSCVTLLESCAFQCHRATAQILNMLLLNNPWA